MKRIKGILMIAAFSVLVMGLPAIASAQYGNGGYYPNGGNYPNGNNGGYGNNGYYGDVSGTLRDLRDRARNLERTVDRDRSGGYNNGGWGGYGNGGYNRNSNEDLKRALNRFSDATKDLDNNYKGGRDLNRSADEAQRVMNTAREVEQMLYNYGGNGYWRNEWNMIQNHLGVVANVYGYNRGGRTNRTNRNGGWNNNNRNMPSWWPF